MNDLFAPKNDCGKKELLVAYLYDEASKNERTELEQHLPACSACRAELQSFKGVRNDLSAWQIPVVPHVSFVPPRSAVAVLRELFQLVPGWLKLTSGLATAAAAALVAFALTGLSVSYGNNGFSASFGKQNNQLQAKESELPVTTTPAKNIDVNTLSRQEVEQMIQVAVAQTKAEAQQLTQSQLANLESKLLATNQMNLQNAAKQFRKEYQQKMQAELAKYENGNRQTLTEWLFAASDAGNVEKEVKANDENN